MLFISLVSEIDMNIIHTDYYYVFKDFFKIQSEGLLLFLQKNVIETFLNLYGK